MKIIPLINEITNSFNEIFKNNLNPLNLESKIRDVGDTFTLKLYESFLNYFDESFKKSKQRKKEFNVKETRKRTLITSIGVITINSTSYIDKETGEYFVPLRDILHLKPYQRLTNEAEYQLTKYTMEENYDLERIIRQVREEVSEKSRQRNDSGENNIDNEADFKEQDHTFNPMENVQEERMNSLDDAISSNKKVVPTHCELERLFLFIRVRYFLAREILSFSK